MRRLYDQSFLAFAHSHIRRCASSAPNPAAPKTTADATAAAATLKPEAPTEQSMHTPSASLQQQIGGGEEEECSKTRARNAALPHLLTAVKSRNFNDAQSHAAIIAQSYWREEYAIPVICAFLLVIVQYWLSSSRRHVKRCCEASEGKMKEDTDAIVEQVRSLSTRWLSDMHGRETQEKQLFEKNAKMTQTIDQLAAALKSCAPRGFQAAQ